MKSFEEARPTKPASDAPTSSGDVANVIWQHIEKRQLDHSESEDMKISIVVTGAPYIETHTTQERRRDDITYVRHLITTLGADPSHTQRVFRFPKQQANDLHL